MYFDVIWAKQETKSIPKPELYERIELKIKEVIESDSIDPYDQNARIRELAGICFALIQLERDRNGMS